MDEVERSRNSPPHAAPEMNFGLRSASGGRLARHGRPGQGSIYLRTAIFHRSDAGRTEEALCALRLPRISSALLLPPVYSLANVQERLRFHLLRSDHDHAAWRKQVRSISGFRHQNAVMPSFHAEEGGRGMKLSSPGRDSGVSH